MAEQYNAPKKANTDSAADAGLSAESEAKTVESYIPLGMRVASAWSWRLLITGLAIAAVVWLLAQVHEVLIPLIIALLLAALLQPIVTKLVSWKVPRLGAVLVAILVLAMAVAALVWLSSTQLRSSLDNMTGRIHQAVHEFLTWLDNTRPFGIDTVAFEKITHEMIDSIGKDENRAHLVAGALGVASNAAHIFASVIVILFALIFFLLDGRRIWYWALGFLPSRAHAMVDTAAQAGWGAVGRYTRMQILVASINSVGIGLGTLLLGVPFAIPIAILVFLFSFVPFMGAIVSGVFAVLIALLYNGPLAGVMMLIVVILVHQIESHVLQPLIMGNALQIHPLAVVVTVPTALMLVGVAGALFAVPFVAAISAMVDQITSGAGKGDPDPLVEYRDNKLRLKNRKAKLKAERKKTKRQ